MNMMYESTASLFIEFVVFPKKSPTDFTREIADACHIPQQLDSLAGSTRI